MNADGSKFPSKQDNSPVFASPDDYNTMIDQLKRKPGRICIDDSGSNSLDQHGVSLPESEQQSASPRSTERQVSRVKELQVQKYKDPVLDIQHSRKGFWPHLYQLAGGGNIKSGHGDPLLKAKDKLMVSVRKTSRKADVNAWHVRHLKSKHIDERVRVCIDGTNTKNSDSECAMLPQDARKILSTSSFSQFFGKKTPKGKGVIYGHSDENCGTLQTDGRLTSSVGFISDVHEKLVQQNSSGTVLDPKCAGVNLREWLKAGNMKNKDERLKVFCQIAEMVGLAHSQGIVLQHLRPSYFILTPSKKLKYIGPSSRRNVDISVSIARGKKRAFEEDVEELSTSNMKQQKLITDIKFPNHLSRAATFQDNSYNIGCSYSSGNTEHQVLSMVSCQTTVLESSPDVSLQLEEKWYACPEDLDDNVSTSSSNVYCLGVLLFELLCSYDSLETHSGAMFDMHHRILPPLILSESPKEAGFCLWLMHPDPSSRPTIR